jgi:hypothetical protein
VGMSMVGRDSVEPAVPTPSKRTARQSLALPEMPQPLLSERIPRKSYA